MEPISKTTWWVGAVSALVYIVDRAFKQYVVNGLTEYPTWVVSQFFGITYELNAGIGYGIPLPSGVILGLAIIITLTLIYAGVRSWKRRDIPLMVAMVYIVIGSVSNIIDRIQHGGVIDYLYISYAPTFNLADTLIITGTIMVIVHIIKNQRAGKRLVAPTK